MRRALLISLRMSIVTAVLLGVVYPLTVWAIGRVVFPAQAAGSLITSDGRVVGSRLIGQSFARPGYFHGRPSAAGDGYDASASSASNLGPTSRALYDQVRARVARTIAENPGATAGAVPVDLVTASGSGLDPDISPDSAYLQVERVAQARQMDAAAVRDLVTAHVTGRQLGFMGEPRVNVLELNLALDAAAAQ